MRADDRLPRPPARLPAVAPPVDELHARRRVLVGRRERGDWRCAVAVEARGRSVERLLPSTTLGDLLALPHDRVADAAPAPRAVAQRRRNA